MPVLIANDANCFALAETHLGAVRQHHPSARVVFGIIMGTGVGSGIVINGQILNGHHGIAGEWGHHVLSPDGPECYCGKRGCVETIVSGSALAAWMTETFPGEPVGEAFVRHGDHGFIGNFVEQFAMIAASEANIFDPEVLFLAGGVVMMPGFPQERLKSSIQAHLRTPQPREAMAIVFSQTADGAGAEGACLAALAVL